MGTNRLHYLRPCVIALFCALWLSNGSLAQSDPDSFVITVAPETMKLSEATKVLQSASWDTYRFTSKRRTLKFVSGMEVELLSAKELAIAGIQFNRAVILTDQTMVTNPPVFQIHEGGRITANHDIRQSK